MPLPVFQPRGFHPPQSNAERQRDFQRRHPGYDRRRKAHERGRLKRVKAAFPELWARLLAEAAQAEAAKAAAEVLRVPVPTWRLALPAPAESPAMAALNELPRLLAAACARERIAA